VRGDTEVPPQPNVLRRLMKTQVPDVKEKITFSFGKNWQVFLGTLTEGRLKHAEQSLSNFLKLKDLSGKTVLDIGCGSGLFSYSAFKLNAKRIVSFDVDPFSVECCRHLHQKAGSPTNWEITHGSILDDQFISKLGTFDIVYSWGVLHHTGKMWDAIKESAKLVNQDGYYYIAIYNKAGGMLGSNSWLRIKKLYNQHPWIGKHVLENGYILTYFVLDLVKLKNPLKKMKTFKQKRGMTWRTDITDWVGGYPYEFATVEEIFTFLKLHFPEFELINIKTTNELGNNWFLFKRR
jgi:2-polyprenyl-3-methyl-5-hydroxy-6-metoxy-1,4-benzoquinol methylase